MAPKVGSCLKDISLWEFRVAAALQILLKEWEQDVLAVVLTGIGGEAYGSQVIALMSRPAAMDPWADDQPVENSRIVLIYSVKSRKGSL